MKSVKIPVSGNYNFEWYNEGFKKSSPEKWTDKSVGKGCDIEVNLDNGTTISIEVKTSKRVFPYFKMTSYEMQKMEEQGSKYVLVKLNSIENLLQGKSPEIISIVDPFKKIFHPKNIKEATFIIGGK